MPSFPLPFVVAILLIVALVRMHRHRRKNIVSRFFQVFSVICITQLLITGLNWNYGFSAANFLQPIVASLLPSIAWISFRRMQAAGAARGLIEFWPHLFSTVTVTVIVILLTAPEFVDTALITLFSGYGVSLLWQARRNKVNLGAVRITDENTARRCLLTLGVLLLGMACIDTLVAVDFSVNKGQNAELTIAAATFVLLAITTYMAALAGLCVPEVGPISSSLAIKNEDSSGKPDSSMSNSTSDIEDALLVKVFNELMESEQLYKDPNLTLNGLALRMDLPARHISGAINRVYRRNLSQVVNDFRVDEVKRLLTLDDRSVTSIMFDSGFQTKSSFNREFRRVTSMSPSDYRRRSNQQRNTPINS